MVKLPPKLSWTEHITTQQFSEELREKWQSKVPFSLFDIGVIYRSLTNMNVNIKKKRQKTNLTQKKRELSIMAWKVNEALLSASRGLSTVNGGPDTFGITMSLESRYRTDQLQQNVPHHEFVLAVKEEADRLFP